MTPETGTLIVRQTFMDRSSEVPAELHIERTNLSTEEERVSSLTAKRLDEGLKSTSTLVAGSTVLFAKWARDFKKHSNKLPLFNPEVSNAAGGDPNIWYYHSHWALQPDEALVIEVVPPDCEYWNFQLNNYWMESLDYRFYRIHINNHLATYHENGSVRIIVAHEDPELPNWLDTAGHSCGTMCFRWVKAKANPEPKTTVVKLQEMYSKSEYK